MPVYQKFQKIQQLLSCGKGTILGDVEVREIMAYKTILFDLDGTLLDTLEDLADAVNHILERHRCPQRTLDEVVRWLMEMDYIPSFCTACYREGRTGDRFMSLCKSGQIQNCCHPNALMTLKEYLMDYASPQTKVIGDKLIDKEVLNVPNEKVRNVVLENLRLIEQDNRRDFRF